MMTDQYIDQYKNEMAQVNAPMDLIEKTKAAVRQEEERILRERRGQEKTSGTVGMRAKQERTFETAVNLDGTKRLKSFAVRKWAYPLTAAAALLILVSVSLTMRGIKENRSGADSVVYKESAPEEAGFEEEAALEPEAAAGAPVELAEEDASVDMAAESVEEGASMDIAAESAEEETVLESAAGGEPQEAAAGGAENEKTAALSVKEEQRSVEETKQAADVMNDMAQDTADAGATKGYLNLVTIEKVEKRPAFCGMTDTKLHVYEGITFLVKQEESGWKAYVEAENGTGYVLYGEAENLDDFLAAGYEKFCQRDTME